MSVYHDIITWSGNKANFLRDALRRLILSPALSATDIDELTELLKKEVGFTGITRMPIPHAVVNFTKKLPYLVRSFVCSGHLNESE